MVVCDLEAGVGSLLRMGEGDIDITLVIVEPSAKSIEAGRRAAEIAAERGRVIVVANRAVDDSDVELIRSGFHGHEFVVVPEDPVIRRADRDGLSPIDSGSEGPGLTAIARLAARLSGAASTQGSEA